MHSLVYLFFYMISFNIVYATSPSVKTDEDRVLLSANTAFNPPISDILEALSYEAFNRIGIDIEFQLMPAERSVRQVSQGIDDIDCCRVREIMETFYPELIAVPESLFQVTFSAFVKDSTIKITQWDNLKPYSVGVVKGYIILTTKSKEVNPRHLIILDNAKSMMKMLEMGRIDVAILSYEDGLGVIKELGFQGIKAQIPPLLMKPLHIMLNKKHEHYSVELSKVIKEMKADGTIKKIIVNILKQYEQYVSLKY